MHPFPVSPLVRHVQSLIVQTFDVSEEIAEDYAAGMVALAEDWGNSENARQMDWSYRVKKDLGETKKLRWRSQEDRRQFEEAQKQKYAAWDAFINTKPRA